MIKRYPDNAVIVFQKTTTDNDGLPGSDTSDDCELEVQGRYEYKDAQSGNYTGKFYCGQVDFCLYKGNAEKLKLGDREFEIMKIGNHQTHTELWLR